MAGGVGAAMGHDVMIDDRQIEGIVFGVDPGEVIADFGVEFADGGVGEGDAGADGDVTVGHVFADDFDVVDAVHEGYSGRGNGDGI